MIATTNGKMGEDMKKTVFRSTSQEGYTEEVT